MTLSNILFGKEYVDKKNYIISSYRTCKNEIIESNPFCRPIYCNALKDQNTVNYCL